MRYIGRVDVAFNEYVPVIMTVATMGIVSNSVFVFSMVCFFGYVFSSLLFNYADLLNKLKNRPEEGSIFSKINYLVSGMFVMALFVSYWINVQY